MRGWRRQVAGLSVAAFAACAALASAPALGDWDCGAALQPTCPSSSPAAADGSLPVTTPLQRLPAPVRGAPLFARDAGHLLSGFNVWVGPGSLSGDERGMITRAFGGTLVRFPINWAFTQARWHGSYDWRATDQLYRTYIAAGARPVLELVASPRWAVSSYFACDFHPERGLQSQQECDIGPNAGHVGDFDAFAVAAARRYPLAAALEIWNEPNYEGYWRGRDPAAYAELADSAVAAVKASAPAMRVLVGALANATDDGPRWTAMATFVAALRDRGVLSRADGLSFHPYPGNIAEFGFTGAFAALQATLPAGSDIRLVVSEIGASALGGGVNATAFTPEQQRDVLVKEYRELDAGDPTVPWSGSVDAVVFNGDVDPQGRFGFVDRGTDGKLYPRPVFCAMAAILGGSGPCTGAAFPPPPVSSPQAPACRLLCLPRRRHRVAARRHPRRYRAMTIAVHALSRNVPDTPARSSIRAIAADGG
jgi:hypothetical protein